MSAKIVNMMQYLIKNREESFDAVKRVMLRPYPAPTATDKHLTDEQMAAWFLEGLWMEGFRVVRVTDDE